MSNKYSVVSGVVFGVVAVLQAVRALNQWPLHVGSLEIPVWASWIAMVFAAVSACGHSDPGQDKVFMRIAEDGLRHGSTCEAILLAERPHTEPRADRGPRRGSRAGVVVATGCWIQPGKRI
jgi:hypothetical protein